MDFIFRDEKPFIEYFKLSDLMYFEIIIILR